MKLSEYRKDSDYYSSSASSINRGLSFSGIAIIWLFTQSGGNELVLEKILLIALSLLALSLLVDLIQYCFGFYKWSKFHRAEELKAHGTQGKIIEDDVDILAPTSTKAIIDTLFWIKIILNMTGYILIITFLVKNVFVK
jgi:hypothetical protein